jgi:hypothetical protein
MKLVKLLVGVNVAAIMPVVMESSASASNNSEPKTGDWLKESIAKLDTTNLKQSERVAQSQGARSLNRSSQATSVNSKSIQMQPFVPNRRLPHKDELAITLKAQEAKFAPVPTTNLSGRVSSFYPTSQENLNAYGSFPPANSKTSIQALPATGRQTSRLVLSSRSQTRPTSAITTDRGSLRPSASNVAAPLSAQNFFAKDSGFSLMHNAERMLLSHEHSASDEDDSQSSFLTDAGDTRDSRSLKDHELSTTGSAGPPPFPLNLLPEDSLRRFVRGMACSRVAAPKVYFGCWHNDGHLAALPSGGFQNYSNRLAAGSTAAKHQRPAALHSAAGMPRTHSLGATAPVVGNVQRNANFSRRNSSAPRPQEPKTAIYPPYHLSAVLF